MAFGAQPSSTTPAVRQPAITLPRGNGRTWGIAIPGKDMTGWPIEWTLGIPERPELLGLFQTQPYAPPQVNVLKATGAGLNVIVTGNGPSLVSNIRFSLTSGDTILLPPRFYWQEAVVTDPTTGLPVTVADGPVLLSPSLRALRFVGVDPTALAPAVQDDFAIYQGDSTPPKVWGFAQNDGTAPNFSGAVFELTITGLLGGSTVVLRTDSGDGTLTLDQPTATVMWPYTQLQSMAVQPSGTAYQLHQLFGGSRQLRVHGQIKGLAP